MLELYEELTGRPGLVALVEISGEEFYGPGYEDSSRLPPDVAKLRPLGWAPRHDIRATFRDAMAYLPGAVRAATLDDLYPLDDVVRLPRADPRVGMIRSGRLLPRRPRSAESSALSMVALVGALVLGWHLSRAWSWLHAEDGVRGTAGRRL